MKKFVKAVIITTVLSILTRAVGLLIKINLSREIGAEAIGFYQIALSVFFLLCTFVTSGIPLIISRTVSSSPKNTPKIVFSGLVLSTTISTMVCLFVVFFPNIITKLWGQSNSLPVLFWLLPAVVFTAIYVPFRGAFWGNKDFFMLGFTELIEQIFRFVACIICFNLSSSLSGAEIAGATYSFACVASSLFAIIIYFIKGNKIKPSIKHIKPLLLESAPIATIRIGSSLVNLCVSFLFPAMLVKSGIQLTEAVGYFGVVTGMVMPLISISGTIISSIAVALIPEISSRTEKFVSRRINLALSYSIIISFLLVPVFWILGEPIGEFLFNDSLAGELLKMGSFLLLPMGISQISSSILNAIGKEKQGLLTYTIGSIGLILSITFLPKYVGIYALLAGFFFMSLISALLNLIIISRHLTFYSLKTLIFSLICIIPASLLCHWSYNITKTLLSAPFALTISGSIALLCMIILYQAFNFIDIKDYLPARLSRA